MNIDIRTPTDFNRKMPLENWLFCYYWFKKVSSIVLILFCPLICPPTFSKVSLLLMFVLQNTFFFSISPFSFCLLCILHRHFHAFLFRQSCNLHASLHLLISHKFDIIGGLFLAQTLLTEYG